jgi:legumain
VSRHANNISNPPSYFSAGETYPPWPFTHLLSHKNFSSNNIAGDVWAVLIAGSAGWGNYRHQADVAHAYQVLSRGGIPDDHIIVMVYNDIANNPENPRPGTLINHPTGEDVYANMPLDYTKDNVNAETFLAILTGNETAIPQNGPHSTGKMIHAGPNDRIFVFYSDHGAPGIIGMPSGDFLYADQLHKAIKHRKKHHGFAEMVLYIEACESGSMFKGLLEDDLGIYAVTAANEKESSWGVYCPGMEPSPPAEYNTCLGDLYSVSWMEDSDSNDLTAETLKKQYQKVRLRTSQNYTYTQGSHVERFGELEIDEEEASRYLGRKNTGGGESPSSLSGEEWTALQDAIPQREADLVPLMVNAKRHAGTEKGAAAAAELEAVVARRRAVDEAIHQALEQILSLDGGVLSIPSSLLSCSSFISTTGGILTTEYLMNEIVPEPNGTEALVSDWDCLRAMVNAWSAAHGPLDQYGMKHTRVFANLCNLNVSPEQLGGAAAAEEVFVVGAVAES